MMPDGMIVLKPVGLQTNQRTKEQYVSFRVIGDTPFPSGPWKSTVYFVVGAAQELDDINTEEANQ